MLLAGWLVGWFLFEATISSCDGPEGLPGHPARIFWGKGGCSFLSVRVSTFAA